MQKDRCHDSDKKKNRKISTKTTISRGGVWGVWGLVIAWYSLERFLPGFCSTLTPRLDKAWNTSYARYTP